MQTAILFKILQRQLFFRNPDSLTALPHNMIYSESEYRGAREYIEELRANQISFTHPGHPDYPLMFLKMKEPPLFVEYRGEALWLKDDFISVVGTREPHALTESWMRRHLGSFLEQQQIGVVSGGARGVDQLAHLLAIKYKKPTVFVLPSGIENMYPRSLHDLAERYAEYPLCFLSEFELRQQIHRSNFYVRNRLIAALGALTLVVQADIKSGSLLTVHHCLEIGRTVATVCSHPEIQGFGGNLKLLHEGAYLTRNANDLRELWQAESWS
jgi:DNA processing protein